MIGEPNSLSHVHQVELCLLEALRESYEKRGLDINDSIDPDLMSMALTQMHGQSDTVNNSITRHKVSRVYKYCVIL